MSANGHVEKQRCTGPAHAQPIYLPVNENFWNFHRSGPKKGQPVARCKLCVNWTKLLDPSGPHGFATVSAELRQLATELVERCNNSAYRLRHQHGLRPETVKAIAAGTHTRIQKRTAAKILSALVEQRKIDRKHGVVSTEFQLATRKRSEYLGRMDYRLGRDHGISL